ncbi:MAG: hypothetical protein LCH96_00150 [Actinobacteria bacterium]|nr:hypothetical protein [Actinomycetota bacterium]
MALTAADADRIRPVKEQVEDELLALPGVTGVDIDEVTVDGALVPGIVVYVDPAVAGPDVRTRIPASVQGVPVEVRDLRVELQGGLQ